MSISKKDKVRLKSGSLALVLDVISENKMFSVFVSDTCETRNASIDEILSVFRYEDVSFHG